MNARRQIDRARLAILDAASELREDRLFTGRAAGAARAYKRTARRAERRAARLEIRDALAAR